jgi:RES domain-containing protein
MRLWRLIRAGHEALDGAGAAAYGGRYSEPGRPVVAFASEAGLAVLVTLRYLADDPLAWSADYRLGWTEIDAPAPHVDSLDEAAIKLAVANWLDARKTLLLAVQSRVLPEANVVLMNPLHGDAPSVPPLATRPFRFDECLHRPPMLERFRDQGDGLRR